MTGKVENDLGSFECQTVDFGLCHVRDVALKFFLFFFSPPGEWPDTDLFLWRSFKK